MSSSVAVKCGICLDTRWANAPGGGVTRCQCWLDAQLSYAEGVPLEFRSASFDTYRVISGNETAVKAANSFIAGDRDLYLCGGVGSGKTRLACTVLNAFHKRSEPSLFTRVPMLLMKLQPQRELEAQAESARLLWRLCSIPVLVLDDIGAERDSATDFTRRTLLTVYEDRCDKGLRTIWTSNLGLAPDPRQLQNPHRQPTLGEFMGDDRLASRIAGRAQVVMLTTPDQRIRRRRGDE